MKRVIYAMLMVPLALCVAYGLVNFGSDVVSGNLNILDWIASHKVILAFMACYIGLQFVGPFKKV
jgi:hypothetical protein